MWVSVPVSDSLCLSVSVSLCAIDEVTSGFMLILFIGVCVSRHGTSHDTTGLSFPTNSKRVYPRLLFVPSFWDLALPDQAIKALELIDSFLASKSRKLIMPSWCERGVYLICTERSTIGNDNLETLLLSPRVVESAKRGVSRALGCER